ncbi:hypothetical protein BMW23_1007 [Bodo saltans virus]|uniref:Uncharacterized protein n=1 Tax=Bodo saltans virus TaxID=2024608 RepID=A0A2H4UVU3_9VIRU|nr:hypothetical protein QJ851_gp0989 [Bodo saltans virus]ATZ81052.1 hypothetical protein BMW23_1007 [Bodo saltans virus]
MTPCLKWQFETAKNLDISHGKKSGIIHMYLLIIEYIETTPFENVDMDMVKTLFLEIKNRYTIEERHIRFRIPTIVNAYGLKKLAKCPDLKTFHGHLKNIKPNINQQYFEMINECCLVLSDYEFNEKFNEQMGIGLSQNTLETFAYMNIDIVQYYYCTLQTFVINDEIEKRNHIIINLYLAELEEMECLMNNDHIIAIQEEKKRLIEEQYYEYKNMIDENEKSYVKNINDIIDKYTDILPLMIEEEIFRKEINDTENMKRYKKKSMFETHKHTLFLKGMSQNYHAQSLFDKFILMFASPEITNDEFQCKLEQFKKEVENVSESIFIEKHKNKNEMHSFSFDDDINEGGAFVRIPSDELYVSS